MSQITMEELQGGHEALGVEVNQLKTQMNLIMEILRAMISKQGNPMPADVPKVVIPVNMSTPLHIRSFLMDIIHNLDL